MDLVADVLEVSGVRGTIGARIEAGGDWSLPVAGCHTAILHVVTAGNAWLGLSSQWLELTAGDVVLMPGGPAHVLGGTPVTDVSAAGSPVTDRSVITVGTPPARTHILSIGYDCDHTVKTQVLGAMPELVHIRGDQGEDGFDDTIRMFRRELGQPRLAGRAVLNSLVDVLLVQLMRVWLPTRPNHRGTWLGALDDPLVHHAMGRLHAEPARQWTTTTLAASLDVSRATLSRRFETATGQSPATYLTQWRMDLAAVRLRKTQDSVESVAAAVGYQSVPAFSRAFTRSHGAAPGRYRRSMT